MSAGEPATIIVLASIARTTSAPKVVGIGAAAMFVQLIPPFVVFKICPASPEINATLASTTLTERSIEVTPEVCTVHVCADKFIAKAKTINIVMRVIFFISLSF